MKTRVAFYTENRLVGGAERYLIELMNRLDPARHELRLIHAHNPVFEAFVKANLRAEAQVSSVPIRSLAASSAGRAVIGSAERGRTALLALSAYPRALVRYVDFAVNRARLTQLFKSNPCDVLHVNNGGYPGGHSCRAAILAAADAGMPVRLMAVHNVAYDYTPVVAIEKWLDRHVENATQQFITQSNAARASLIRRRGVRPDKITNIYFGVDLLPPPSPEDMAAKKRELGVPEGAPVVGMIAMFEPRKGYQVLLQAAPAILGAVPSAVFVLVGDGPFYETIRAQAVPQGDRVIFTGHRRDFRDILATFDVLVLPTLEFESVPYVILEAMALGKPAVGSTDGGIPEAIANGETGLLVPPGDTDALARAINTILTNDGLARRMGQAGLERARRVFDMNAMVAKMQAMYQAYLGR
jgi:glycosyltransferase involved in cell wall biosynthesis